MKLSDFKIGDKVKFVNSSTDRPTATQICCNVPWWKIPKGTIGEVTYISKDSITVKIDCKFNGLSKNIKEGEKGDVFIYEKAYPDSVSLKDIQIIKQP